MFDIPSEVAMSFTPTGEYRFDLFRAMTSYICPGAKGAVRFSDREDSIPIYYIYLKNGMDFEGTDHIDVYTRARAYAENVLRLTGEYP